MIDPDKKAMCEEIAELHSELKQANEQLAKQEKIIADAKSYLIQECSHLHNYWKGIFDGVPQPKEHEETLSCWCEPEIERHEEGVVIIHRDFKTEAN